MFAVLLIYAVAGSVTGHTNKDIIGTFNDVCKRCRYTNGAGYVPYPNKCGKYIQCWKSLETYLVKSCPTSLHWDVAAEACNVPAAASCLEDYAYEEVCKTSDDTNGYVSYPGQCDTFVQCYDQQKTYGIRSCPYGLHWDSVFKTCNYPWAAKCANGYNVDCSSPPPLSNGSVKASSTTFTSLAIYTCNMGYAMTGNGFSMCQQDGTWSAHATVCKDVDCSSPPPIPNGSVKASSTIFTSTAKYTCNRGYAMIGNGFSMCQQDGTWSAHATVCKDKNECVNKENNCHINAVCRNTVGSFTCTCNRGYTGNGVTCKEIFGMACSSTTQCGFTHSSCKEGLCECALGYSYKPRHGTCVQRCTQYGNLFSSPYYNHGVGGCNIAKLYTATPGKCREACRTRKSFVCTNAEFEIKSGKCYLCNKSWFDLRPNQRLTKDIGWILYHRNCV